MRLVSRLSRWQLIILTGMAVSLIMNVALLSFWLSQRSIVPGAVAASPAARDATAALAVEATDPDLLLQSEMVAAPEEIAVASDAHLPSPQELIRAHRPDPLAFTQLMVGRWVLTEKVTPMDGWEMRETLSASSGAEASIILVINPDYTGAMETSFSYQGTSAVGDPEPFVWWTDPDFPTAILMNDTEGDLTGAGKLTFSDSQYSLRMEPAVPDASNEDDGWMIFWREPDSPDSER